MPDDHSVPSQVLTADSAALPPTPAPADSKLRVVSYNVRYFGHALRGLASTLGPKRRVAAALAGLDPLPDVICLQEVETRSLRSRSADRHSEPTQLDAFMGRMSEMFSAVGLAMPYRALYFPAHTYRIKRVNLYTTGLAVLIHGGRLMVESDNAASPQPITHRPVSALRNHKQTRICAHVRVRTLGGQALNVFNTHLSLPNPFKREFWSQTTKMGFGQNQLHEARQLAEFVHRHARGEPFIVAGDFNTAPDSPVFGYLSEEAGFSSAQHFIRQMSNERGRFPTAGFMRLRMHLDHLFGGGVSFEDLEGTYPFGDRRSPFFGVSDHVPIIGRVSLNDPGKASSFAT